MASSSINKKHNQTLLASLEPGDLIELPRRLYSHWAVYIGNEKVVRLTGDENDGIRDQVNASHTSTISSKSFKKAKVVKAEFWHMVGTAKAQKNNASDGKYRPFSKDKIVENALEKIGWVGYNILFENCEHFANWCHYGKKRSKQAEAMFKLGAAAAFASASAAVFALKKCGSKVRTVHRLKRKKKKKKKQ